MLPWSKQRACKNIFIYFWKKIKIISNKPCKSEQIVVWKNFLESSEIKFRVSITGVVSARILTALWLVDRYGTFIGTSISLCFVDFLDLYYKYKCSWIAEFHWNTPESSDHCKISGLVQACITEICFYTPSNFLIFSPVAHLRDVIFRIVA